MKVRLEVFALIVACGTGITGLFGAFVILPYKVEALEAKVETQARKSHDDHELLVRIEERLIVVQRQLEKKP